MRSPSQMRRHVQSNSCGRARRQRRRSAVVLAAAMASLPAFALAQTTDWVGSVSGSWSNGSNWSNGEPAAGETVDIVQNTTNLIHGYATTINYDYTGAAISLGSLTLDNPINGAETISMAANSLTVTGSEVIGQTGMADFNQSGGSNSAGNLILGQIGISSATYTLTGAASLFASGNEYVGFLGSGIFNQTGGVNSIGSNLNGNSGTALYVGYLGGSTGTYVLSGTGNLSPIVPEVIGEFGVGNFNQSGGTNDITNDNNLVVGDMAGSIGTYSLSGGSASAQGGMVGNSGIGNFNQTGGTISFSGNSSTLLLGNNAGSTGTYSLSAGSLSAPGETIGNAGIGNFNQSGGINNSSDVFLGAGGGATGTYNISAGTLTALMVAVGSAGGRAQ
jgi:hypothetical protein